MALRRWESIAGNLVLTTEFKTKLANVKGKKVDVSIKYIYIYIIYIYIYIYIYN